MFSVPSSRDGAVAMCVTVVPLTQDSSPTSTREVASHASIFPPTLFVLDGFSASSRRVHEAFLSEVACAPGQCVYPPAYFM